MKRKIWSGLKGKPYITIGLIAVNVIVFFLLEILGNSEDAVFMMEHGAAYPPYILEQKEYWRLFTSNFMHFGPTHLLNNMVMLGAAGVIVEKALGKVKYLMLYLIAGVGGSILSLLQMMKSGNYAVSAGASGAVFGLLGALLWIVIRNKGKYETITGKGMIFMIALALYYGVSAGNVDNWGHVGGLLMGFFLAILFYRKNKKCGTIDTDSNSSGISENERNA